MGGNVNCKITNVVVGLLPLMLLRLQLGLEHSSSAVDDRCTCMYDIEGPQEGMPWVGSRGHRSNDCSVQ